MRRILLGLAAVCSTGCASVSTIPLSKDSFQITSNTIYGCGIDGAQRVAYKQAAAETIRRGYDSFLILDTDRDSRVDGASSFYGGASFSHQHSQGLKVKMFKEGDPTAGAAISARETLGPKWEEAIKPDTSYSCA